MGTTVDEPRDNEPSIVVSPDDDPLSVFHVVVGCIAEIVAQPGRFATRSDVAPVLGELMSADEQDPVAVLRRLASERLLNEVWGDQSDDYLQIRGRLPFDDGWNPFNYTSNDGQLVDEDDAQGLGAALQSAWPEPNPREQEIIEFMLAGAFRIY